uniref:L-Fucosyltransferase n=1 Tax=Meloidogyne hapla TaxID=6305 RepID=A0A1I8B9E2_MELHA
MSINKLLILLHLLILKIITSKNISDKEENLLDSFEFKGEYILLKSLPSNACGGFGNQIFRFASLYGIGRLIGRQSAFWSNQHCKIEHAGYKEDDMPFPNHKKLRIFIIHENYTNNIYIISRKENSRNEDFCIAVEACNTLILTASASTFGWWIGYLLNKELNKVYFNSNLSAISEIYNKEHFLPEWKPFWFGNF